MIKEPLNLLCEYLSNPIGIDSISPRLSWNLESDERDQRQTAYQIIVSSSRELIDSNVGDKWDSGKVKSDRMLQVEYMGQELKSRSKCFWKVRVWDKNDVASDFSKVATFEMGLLEQQDWHGSWIGAEYTREAPLLRSKMQIEKEIIHARAYICGLGYYELYINGKKVGDHVLDPNRTDYDSREVTIKLPEFAKKTTKSVLYVTYDVTEHIITGENVAGVILGNGWYNQRERQVEGHMQYGIPKMLFQLEVFYKDGDSVKYFSDGSWKTDKSPIIYNNIYYGEIYDAGLEESGWNYPGYDDSNWKPVRIANKPEGILKSQMSVPDKVISRIKPQRMFSSLPGIFVFDMGQNFSGWVKIKNIMGLKGQKIILRFSEEINEDNTISTQSAGWGEQIQMDVYVSKGEDFEEYEPRFSWHGFRYVEVTNFPGKISLDCVEGVVVHSAVDNAGMFECSNQLFNKIQNNYLWSQKSNMHGGVPSDCPHRERLGYTGDGQIAAEASIFNFKMSGFYTKWLKDIIDSQDKETGYVPNTAPYSGGGGGPAWGSACVIIPWHMYIYYGDTRILQECYESMKAWIRYLGTKTDEGSNIIIGEPDRWYLGEWCTPGEVSVSKQLVNTFYYAYCLKLIKNISEILEKPFDTEFYSKLGMEVKNDFIKEFWNEKNGMYLDGKQGSNVFPLAIGLVEEKNRAQVVQNIVKNIVEDNAGHLDTGIFGTPLLFDVLVDEGYGNLAYSILNKKTYPSFGYMIERGATTLWECWEEVRGSYNYPISHNHPMFGSISAWFYKKIAGIVVCEDSPGLKHIIIKPNIIGEIDYVKADYIAITGKFRVEWQKKEGTFEISVAIPCNCSAEIIMPKTINKQVVVFEGGIKLWECGRNVEEICGISQIQEDNQHFSCLVGSGEYCFKIELY